MITVASLKNYSLKELAQLAKKSGIDEWHSMRKDELIRALGKTGKKDKADKMRSGPQFREKASTSKASTSKAGSNKAGSNKASPPKTSDPKAIASKASAPKASVSKSSASKAGASKAGASKGSVGKGSGPVKGSSPKAVPAKSGGGGKATSGGKAAIVKSAAGKPANDKTPAPKAAPALKAGSDKPTAAKAAPVTSPGAKASETKGQASRTPPVAHKPTAAKPAAANSTNAKPTAAKRPGDKPGGGAAGQKPAARATAKAAAKPPEKPRNSQVARRIQRANEERERRRDLSLAPEGKPSGSEAEVTRDRVVLIVRDPYWLQATWEVTRQSVQRAHAAMAEQWHTARPILRLMEIENTGTTSSAERLLREIPIHGGVHNWYIDVQDPPKGYRVELGYLGANGKFFGITRSNTVTTPRPGSADSIDENWSDVEENFERIFAQSGGYSEETSSHELQEAIEERLQRPIGPPLSSRFGVGAERILRRRRDFQFDVDADMVVHGQTKPDAHVTLSGEPVKLREDGSFAVRMALPDKRQVIPVVASSRDGGEQRTIVIAVERNTKVMEPMIRESND